MKLRILILLAATLAVGISPALAGSTVSNYFDQPNGGSKDNTLTVGGTQNVASGGTLTIQSGGTFTGSSGSTLSLDTLDVPTKLTVDTIDDSGAAAIAISSHVAVTGNVTLTGTVTADGTVSAEQLTTTDDATITDDLNIGTTARVIDAGTYSIRISTHVDVTGNVTLTGDATVSGGDIDLGNTGRKISDDSTNYGLKFSTMVNMQAYPITNIGSNNTDFESDGTLVSGSGKLGYYGADTNKYYHVLISTELADAEEYTLVSDAKAGAFEVHMGTFSAFGTHTTAAAVTLTTSSSANTSTTNNNAATLNVYDGGTSVIVENKSGSTLQTWIEYWWQN